MPHNAPEKIRNYNKGRDPDRLKLKYKVMRGSPFSFLRGTCHLFYDRLPHSDIFENSPATWICGDMHLGNFGSYKGDNRLTYFDINDFDESLLASCSWDVVRLLTSIMIAAKELHASESEAIELCKVFLNSYSNSLKDGKARWIERATAQGMVRSLLVSLKKRSRRDFIDDRTIWKKSKRVINTDGKKALPVTEQQYGMISAFMEDFASKQPDPKFFRVMDIARRIAGTGSLGVDRYAILVRGNGSPDNNYLLDLKLSPTSSLAKHVKLKQPHWATEAERVVSIQRWMQAILPAFLQHVEINGLPYILKELQPTQDRVDLISWDGKLKRLESVMVTMGELVAWAQLRSSGRRGSSSADELIEFGARNSWKGELLNIATVCSKIAEQDYLEYAKAYDDKFFSV